MPRFPRSGLLRSPTCLPSTKRGGDTLKNMRTAYIGMGGNLASWAGPPEATLAAAARRIESLGRLTCRSSLYSTEPVGFTEQPRFVNAVVELETELEPRGLLNRLLEIECEFGRDRQAEFSNGPRTLDLDLLLFGCIQINEPGLVLPHPRLAERAFVLVPLCEISPRIVDSGRRKTVSQLLHELARKGENAGASSTSEKSRSDAVVKIQTGVWRAGADWGNHVPGAV